MKIPSFTRTAFFRLSLLYILTFAVSSLVVFGLLYLRIATYTAQEIRASIDIEIFSLMDEARRENLQHLAQEVSHRADRSESSSSYYLLQSPEGVRLAGNLEPVPPQPGFREQVVQPIRRDLGRALPPAKVLMRTETLPDGSVLAVGRDLVELTDLDKLITQAFLVAALLCIGVAVAGGVLTSSRFLTRIETIRRASERIVSGDLSERIPVQGSRDELDRLSGTLNAMLDRIQVLMETTQQVSNDIAHDLRTPLTHLRQKLEAVMVRGSSPEDFRDVVGRAIEDVDDILATFSALLRIAEVEAGSRTNAFRPVRLSEIAEGLADTYAAVAEDAGQVLSTRIEPGLAILGDREIITQLLANLVENAIRHCPAGATITIGVARRTGGVCLSVADNGPGIPETEREKVFRRFYRLERSRTTPGSGLGLPMVAAAASIHGGTVAILDNGPGTRVEVVFPASQQAIASA